MSKINRKKLSLPKKVKYPRRVLVPRPHPNHGFKRIYWEEVECADREQYNYAQSEIEAICGSQYATYDYSKV